MGKKQEKKQSKKLTPPQPAIVPGPVSPGEAAGMEVALVSEAFREFSYRAEDFADSMDALAAALDGAAIGSRALLELLEHSDPSYATVLSQNTPLVELLRKPMETVRALDVLITAPVACPGRTKVMEILNKSPTLKYIKKISKKAGKANASSQKA